MTIPLKLTIWDWHCWNTEVSMFLQSGASSGAGLPSAFPLRGKSSQTGTDWLVGVWLQTPSWLWVEEENPLSDKRRNSPRTSELRDIIEGYTLQPIHAEFIPLNLQSSLDVFSTLQIPGLHWAHSKLTLEANKKTNAKCISLAAISVPPKYIELTGYGGS